MHARLRVCLVYVSVSDGDFVVCMVVCLCRVKCSWRESISFVVCEWNVVGENRQVLLSCKEW